MIVPKVKQSHSNPASYRPISLLNTTSSALEIILIILIPRISDCHKNLVSSQMSWHDFGPKYSSYTQLLRIHCCAIINFPDIKRDFDPVWYKSLIIKFQTVNSKSKWSICYIFILLPKLHNFELNSHSPLLSMMALVCVWWISTSSPLFPILYTLFCNNIPTLSATNLIFHFMRLTLHAGLHYQLKASIPPEVDANLKNTSQF